MHKSSSGRCGASTNNSKKASKKNQDSTAAAASNNNNNNERNYNNSNNSTNCCFDENTTGNSPSQNNIITVTTANNSPSSNSPSNINSRSSSHLTVLQNPHPNNNNGLTDSNELIAVGSYHDLYSYTNHPIHHHHHHGFGNPNNSNSVIISAPSSATMQSTNSWSPSFVGQYEHHNSHLHSAIIGGESSNLAAAAGQHHISGKLKCGISFKCG